MRKLYETPIVEEWQLQISEEISAIADSAYNDGEFEGGTWT